MGDVRGALLRAPWWVLSLVTGGLFALTQLVWRLLSGDPPVVAAVTAGATGLLFGLFMGPFSQRTNRRYRDALGDLPRDEEREVRRATMRGPAPADPEVRRAALDVVTHQLEVLGRMQWAYAMWLLLGATSVWLAVSDSPWWAVAAVLFGGFLAYQLWTHRHLRARQRLLDQANRAAMPG